MALGAGSQIGRCTYSPLRAKIRGHLQEDKETMTIHLKLLPVISIAAGVAVLLFPRLLPYIVGIYLIVYGVITLIR